MRARVKLSEADRIYFSVEKILDDHRRAGVPESAVRGVLERLVRASDELAATSLWVGTARR